MIYYIICVCIYIYVCLMPPLSLAQGLAQQKAELEASRLAAARAAEAADVGGHRELGELGNSPK